MSKITTKYYQKCDFCHKNCETGEKGLPKTIYPDIITVLRARKKRL